MSWPALLAVFVGGAVGSLARELLAPMVDLGRPWMATLAVNILACLLIGWLYALRDALHRHLIHFGAVGFCGGFSTFSHFVLEIEGLLLGGAWLEAAAAAALAIGLGIAAAVLGERLAVAYARRRQGP
ncbi:MAG: CrcB family protein [Pseudomonadota bacterium]